MYIQEQYVVEVPDIAVRISPEDIKEYVAIKANAGVHHPDPPVEDDIPFYPLTPTSTHSGVVMDWSGDEVTANRIVEFEYRMRSAGWWQVGGLLITDMSARVDQRTYSRTTWIPNADDWWLGRPENTRISIFNKAIENIKCGKRLGAAQQRAIECLWYITDYFSRDNEASLASFEEATGGPLS